MANDIKIILQEILCAGFNLDELNDLCFSLQLDFEDLPGQTRASKTRELIKYLHRRQRLPDLIQVGRQQRPELQWPDDGLPKPISESAPEPKAEQAASNLAQQSQPESKPLEIYISYAWGGESETITDNMEQQLKNKGIGIIRDKRDLSYKGGIKDFMRTIGQGKFVIVVISDKYLKSENCMFELLEIAEQGDFQQRIFPIVLADANIYKAVNRIKYIEYWETQIADLDTAMKKVSSANLQGIRDDIDNYTRIRAAIAGLTDIIKDMNTLMPETHQDSNFAVLYQALDIAISQDQGKK